MIRLCLDAFWNEAFWLPSNVTWKYLEPSPGKAVTYTDYRHILLAIPMGLVLILLRFILNKYTYAPLGRILGIKDGRNKQLPLNDILEATYKANPALEKIYSLAKKLDVSERQVARWWRLRRTQAKPSTLVKFGNTAWRCTCLYFIFSFGVLTLWDKDWTWDINQCFIGYPDQGITQDVWWYYIVASAFYWSMTFTVLWDVRRKDFTQMLIHHLAAIALLSFSWVCNLHRIGTLVMVSQDGVDALLEMAKAALYAGYHKFANCVFVLFTFLWIIAKLWIYPFYIVRSMFRSPTYMGSFPAYYMFVGLSFVLIALNIYWTWLILQLAIKIIKTGQNIERDIYSSSSDSDSSQSDHDKSDRVSSNK